MSVKNHFLFCLGIIVPALLVVNHNIQVININDLGNIGIFYFFTILIFFLLNYFSIKLLKINLLNFILFLFLINCLTNKFLFDSQLIDFSKFIYLNIILSIIYFVLRVLFKKKISSGKYESFLVLTFSIYFVISFINVYKESQLILNGNKKNPNIFYDNPFKDIKLNQKPDIIHLIPDSLLNFTELEKAGYSTENLEKNFLESGLNIIKNAKSNYSKTHFAIPSFLHGSIIKEDLIWKEKDMYKYINNSTLHSELIKNGYQIEWYETRLLSSKCPTRKNLICANKNFFNNEFFAVFFKSLNFNYAWIEKFQFNFFKKEKIKHVDLIINNLDKYETSKPRYIYGYLDLPHPPFSVLKNCKSAYLYFSNNKIPQPEFNKEQYLEQVDCLQKQILQLIKKLNQRNKEYVMIIQSDTGHYVYGYDKYPSPENDYDYPDEHYESFIAVSSSLKCFENKDKIFNVEVFNILISCLNNTPVPKITNKEKIYSIFHHDHPKYGKIFTFNQKN